LKIDLHVHSTESDGVLSVAEIIDLAARVGVEVLALTDHESTQGVAEAQRLAASRGIKVIPGVEFLTVYQSMEIHLLGYFSTVENALLQSRLKILRQHRSRLAQNMVRILQEQGLPIQWTDVENEANQEVAISKGHIMRALYHGHLITGKTSWQEVAGYFQPGGMAYIPFLEHPFAEAVDLIYATGGVPVLAHPGLIPHPRLISELLAYRPIGLEVYYGYWHNRQELINYFAGIAKDQAIIMTGGSDFHGSFSRVQLGEIDVPCTCVSALEEFLGLG